ncbi:MAG: TlpA disulfide reductase family protein [bacterium]
MKDGSKWIDGLIVVIIVLAMGSGMASFFNGDAKVLPIEAQTAPPFNLKTLAGEVRGPAAHTDRVVVLDFWATWCGPCRKQMPALQRIEDDPKLKEKVVVLSVNTDDPDPNREHLVKSFMAQHNLSFDVLLDNGSVGAMYGVSRIPSIVVIGPSGLVTYARSGVLSESKLRDLIEEASSR